MAGMGDRRGGVDAAAAGGSRQIWLFWNRQYMTAVDGLRNDFLRSFPSPQIDPRNADEDEDEDLVNDWDMGYGDMGDMGVWRYGGMGAIAYDDDMN